MTELQNEEQLELYETIYSKIMDWTSPAQDQSGPQKRGPAMFAAIDDIFENISGFNEYSKALVTLTTAVGALVIFSLTLRLAYKLMQVFRLYVSSQYWARSNIVEKYGQWAVITGSTDGIGQSMAKELAKRGMSIIVIGRNEEKLANTKTMLEAIPNVGEVETIRIDLADSSPENFERIRQQIDAENRDIGILINNAAMNSTKFGKFYNYDMSFLVSCVNCNVIAQLYLTRMLMPSMVARGKGLVLNVSSLVGSLPGPYLGVYAATKAFVNSFTRQLQIEYASHPIDIVLLTPGPVFTNMIKKNEKHDGAVQPSALTPAPDDFARSVINGLSARVHIFSGNILHGFAKEASEFIDSIGLIDYGYRLFRMQNRTNYEL